MSEGGSVVIRGGEVVDATGVHRADVLVGAGIVQVVEESLGVPPGALVLDAGGCLVAPALVDLHTHLREPGAEQTETIESGSRAAALGGYSAVVAMPNTTPAIDCASVVRDVRALAHGALVDVAVAAAITVGRAGERLVPFAELAELGVRLFTDDGAGVQDAGLLRRALEYAGDLGVVLAEHCEDASLAKGGLMHEGAWSSRLGVPGQPALAEEVMLSRDLALVRLTGTPMHFLHLWTAGSIRLLAEARAERLPVTAEVTPHHLSLTDAELSSFDAVFKVNPPLRSEGDVAALRRACADGLIDAIATDHAPHPREAKEAPLEDAPPGMLGLETALSVAWGALVESGLISAARLFSLFTVQPACIAGLGAHGGPIAAGRPAQLCVFDPAERVLVEPERSASRSANTPFGGRWLTGKVRHTLVHGEPVVIDGKAQR